MAAEGVVILGCGDLYDAQITCAVHDLLSGLPPGRAKQVRQQCDIGAEKAEKRFEAFTRGRREDPPGAPVGEQHAGDHLV
eukprot:13785837-Heterocapsa_arctica.AAC.1